jgi:hypothetical protein
VFFKSFYATSPEVVEVSNKGLSFVMVGHHKLPKEYVSWVNL